jgi:hypothetical protein
VNANFLKNRKSSVNQKYMNSDPSSAAPFRDDEENLKTKIKISGFPVISKISNDKVI